MDEDDDCAALSADVLTLVPKTDKPAKGRPL
jgi:hypothetical protein